MPNEEMRLNAVCEMRYIEKTGRELKKEKSSFCRTDER
jgi:hypothetical protein